MFCRIVILTWTYTLHTKKSFCIVKYSILKQNYRTCIKIKIASYVYCRNKLVSHKKVSKVALQKPVFHAFMCFSITENQPLWAFQSYRLIPPVKKTNKLYGHFLWMGFNCLKARTSRLEGSTSFFTTKFPEIPGTHFIDLGRMNDWVDLGAI